MEYLKKTGGLVNCHFKSKCDTQAAKVISLIIKTQLNQK